MPMRRGRLRSLPLFLGLAGAAATLLAARRLDAVEVSGRSMAPALLPGDRLLVESWTYARRAPHRGEVVLAGHPRTPSRELIKRVAAVRDGRVELRGDASGSTDSRRFGTLPLSAVRWRAAVRYWPLARVGPLTVPAREPGRPPGG